MQKIVPVISLIIFFHISSAQSYMEKIQAYQEELNTEYKSKEDSPLDRKDRRKFKGHDFFPIDSGYCIKARFIRTPGQKPFEMQTTTDRKAIYEKYGEAHFMIGEDSFMLNIYQSHRLRKMEGYEDHLFLPFKDYTNGESSYGGGRYIDVRIPSDTVITIDFNKAYNPYCAYSTRFSCPVVPEENYLKTAIKAGVQLLGEMENRH